MARIRSVKPEYWTCPVMADLPRDTRLLYIALWNYADEQGRLLGDPRLIKGQVFPYDDDLTATQVDGLLDVLAEAGRIVRYDVAGHRYVYLPNLDRHQRLDDKVPSRLPGPPCDTSIAPGLIECNNDMRLFEVGDEAPISPGQTADEAPTQVRADKYAPSYVAGSRLQGASSRGQVQTPTAAPPPVLAVVPDPVPTFDDFWSAYPRKVGKGAARKTWDRLTHTVAPSVIFAGAVRYAEDQNLPEIRYRPHPTTWLHRAGWEDEPCPPRREHGGANSTGESVQEVVARAVGQPNPWTDPRPEIEQ